MGRELLRIICVCMHLCIQACTCMFMSGLDPAEMTDVHGRGRQAPGQCPN